ncbi:MAG: zf-TFIIB domain-containing protein [Anaerolineales bacterium]|nr:zf-TFIIB domain-containing protein [Anaerolineales bacterium]
MKPCPLCASPLHLTFLEDQLPVHACPNGDGHWLPTNEYLLWLRLQLQHQQATPTSLHMPAPASVPQTESEKAKICPDCGRLLRRYKVWPNLDFYLDRCNTCNGIWFDQNEWAILKEHKVHDEINLIFTQPWQEQLRQIEAHHFFEAMYQTRFGEDYEEIKRMRAWLQNHPQKTSVIAYLLDDDPYKA